MSCHRIHTGSVSCHLCLYGFHVVRKRTLVCISFTMHFTFTQFLLKLWSGGNAPLVRPEAVFVSESDATLVAFEGFLPCMKDLMYKMCRFVKK